VFLANLARVRKIHPGKKSVLDLGPNTFREKVSTFRAKAPVPSPEF